MNKREGRPGPSRGEFVARTALLISLVALSIDAMLPALAEIGSDLGVVRDNDRQQVISVLFLGLAAGQMVYGPLSDSIGRKPAIYGGLVIFIVGSLLSAFAASYSIMLLGRLLQGFGAAAPRIVVIAIVRDRFEGRAMARIMSLVMAVFILIPALAPAIGQGILLISHWRAIFGVLFGLAAVAFVWFAARQPETLAPERRRPFRPYELYMAVRETCLNRDAFGYTLAAGLIFGAFIGYLTSAQQIFQELYGLGRLFPLYFAILALAIGAASLTNSRLVMRYGMRTLCRWALLTMTGLCSIFFVYALLTAGAPPLWLVMSCFVASFFCFGILFGNLNAMAMEPLGHIAGVAATVIGSLTTFISLALGSTIGSLYNGTVLPLIGGFAALGLAALFVMRWAAKGAGPK